MQDTEARSDPRLKSDEEKAKRYSASLYQEEVTAINDVRDRYRFGSWSNAVRFVIHKGLAAIDREETHP